MIKLENTITPSPGQWMITVLGARNAMNSWDRSDSEIKYENVRDSTGYLDMGPNDHDLLMRLRNAGTDHRKYLRMLPVHVNITAPLYWWKEFDTYKIGTTANSCSTMHKIHEKEFTLDDFSHEHLLYDHDDEVCPVRAGLYFEVRPPINEDFVWNKFISPKSGLEIIIELLNTNRELFLETKDKRYWWQMIQLLPSSYNQKRTVMLNYEVLANIYKSRKNHKLQEWLELCKWIEGLPYSELITGNIGNGEASDGGVKE